MTSYTFRSSDVSCSSRNPTGFHHGADGAKRSGVVGFEFKSLIASLGSRSCRPQHARLPHGLVIVDQMAAAIAGIVFVAQRAEIQIVQLHLELLDLLSELLIFRLCEVNRMAGRTVKRFAVFAKLRPALLRQPQAAAAGMRALNKFELNGRHNYFLFLQLRLSRPVRLPTQRRMS